MKIKSEKARLKAIELLEKEAREEGYWARKKIAEYFAENDQENAFAMFLDMQLHKYPFNRGPFAPENAEDVVTAASEIYGLNRADVGIIYSLTQELSATSGPRIRRALRDFSNLQKNLHEK